jgi:iron complex outermembrane recepter protein
MLANGKRKGFRNVGLALGAVAAISTPVYAQESSDSGKTTQLEQVTVTGSNIRRTSAETSAPLQIITRKDIERTGKQNISDVIRSISADNQGSIPTAFTNGFASGSSAVSLRGLGVNSTLVLINGRRTAPYGLADDGSRTFVDLNTIPLEAVDRVEILKDGASAIYGSDAVAGVINVILRKNYEGGSVGFNLGTSYREDGTDRRLNGSYGFGNLDEDKYNFFVTLEGSRVDAIAQSNRRSFLGTQDLRPYGFFDNRRGAPFAGGGNFPNGDGIYSGATPYGTVRTPGTAAGNFGRTNLTPCPEISPITGVCLFDTTPYIDIQPETSRFNLFSRGTFQLHEKVQAYTEIGYFYSDTKSRGTPSGVVGGGGYNPNDPFNPVFPTVQATLPVGHPDNPFNSPRLLSYLATDFGGRNGETTNQVLRFIGGFTGDVNGFEYDLGGGYIRSDLDQSRTGFILIPVLQAGLDSGVYRINNRAAVPQSFYDAAAPKIKNSASSSIASVDGKVSRGLFDLPGGKFAVAVGGEYRVEQSNTPPVPGTNDGSVIGLGYSAFKGDRSVYDGYIEADAPIFKFLELDAAFRHDQYSDYGASNTPKFGFKLTPIKEFALRGTYSEAFRAPGATESGAGGASLGFTNIAIVSISDPSVRPETAKSFTLGAILEPISGTSASIDYYKIKRRNEIVQADPVAIIGNLPRSGDALSDIAGLTPNSRIYYDEQGQISAVSGPYANANRTTTSGLDIDLRQKISLKEIGVLSASVSWTHVIGFKRILADGSAFEYAGTHGPYVLSSAGGTPRDRGTFNLTFDRANWSVTGTINYVSSLRAVDNRNEFLSDQGDGTFAPSGQEGTYFVLNGQDGQPGCGVYNPDGTQFRGCRIGSFITGDLFGKLTLNKSWELTGSILNVTNELPPFDPYTYGGQNYNPSFAQAGAVGRFYNVGIKYRFH